MLNEKRKLENTEKAASLFAACPDVFYRGSA